MPSWEFSASQSYLYTAMTIITAVVKHFKIVNIISIVALMLSGCDVENAQCRLMGHIDDCILL